MRWARFVSLFALLGVVLTGSGCARLTTAAAQSAKNPRTWAPLVGAALVQIDDMDNKISKWAYRENPVFNSKDNADDWSDAGQTMSWIAASGTLLLVDESWKQRGKDWLVMLGSRELASGTSSVLKNVSSRSRPLEQNDESFPSGHTTRTSNAGTLGRFNLERAGYNKWAPLIFDVTTIGTAWGRVEAGKHHPSDVLVGAALGHFFAETAVLAFIDNPTVNLDVELTPETAYIGVRKGF